MGTRPGQVSSGGPDSPIVRAHGLARFGRPIAHDRQWTIFPSVPASLGNKERRPPGVGGRRSGIAVDRSGV